MNTNNISYVAGTKNNDTYRVREKPFSSKEEAVEYLVKQMRRKFGASYKDKVYLDSHLINYYYTDKDCTYEFYIRKEERSDKMMNCEYMHFII